MIEYPRIVCEILITDAEDARGALVRTLRAEMSLEDMEQRLLFAGTFCGTIGGRMAMVALDADEVGLGSYQAEAMRGLYTASLADDEDIFMPRRILRRVFDPEDGWWVSHAIDVLREQLQFKKP